MPKIQKSQDRLTLASDEGEGGKGREGGWSQCSIHSPPLAPLLQPLRLFPSHISRTLLPFMWLGLPALTLLAPRAAFTNDHRLNDLKQQNFIFSVLEARSLKWRCLQGQVPSEGFGWGRGMTQSFLASSCFWRLPAFAGLWQHQLQSLSQSS